MKKSSIINKRFCNTFKPNNCYKDVQLSIQMSHGNAATDSKEVMVSLCSSSLNITKELLKLVNIWQSYPRIKSGTLMAHNV